MIINEHLLITRLHNIEKKMSSKKLIIFKSYLKSNN